MNKVHKITISYFFNCTQIHIHHSLSIVLSLDLYRTAILRFEKFFIIKTKVSVNNLKSGVRWIPNIIPFHGLFQSQHFRAAVRQGVD